MKRKKLLACLLAAVLLSAGGCATPEPAPEAETQAVTEEETEPETFVFEEIVEAQPGQAYLAIVDSQWWVQYWGGTERGTMLAYDAGVCDITGEGSYTVSVNADTLGFRYDTTDDPYGEYTPSGLGFAAVIIRDGQTLCPDYVITIDSIVIDGREIEMTAKNYTSFEDGHIRSNIFNPYADAPSGDARCPDGMLFNDYDNTDPILPDAADYSPQIVDAANFLSWTKVEVHFTISLLPEKTANEGDTEEAAEPDASGEETDEPTEEDTAAEIPEISEETAEEVAETTEDDVLRNVQEELRQRASEIAERQSEINARKNVTGE